MLDLNENVDLVLNLSASPYHRLKIVERREVLANAAKKWMRRLRIAIWSEDRTNWF